MRIKIENEIKSNQTARNKIKKIAIKRKRIRLNKKIK
jgi:hypothetical protein